jgi:CSLREA domain-containing protein
MKGIARLFSVFLLLSLLLTGQGVRPAYAAGYVVNTLNDDITDDALCTLREAILAANNSVVSNDCGAGSSADDTITFSVSGTITLGSTLPTILPVGALTIDGGGTITISGNNSVRVMYVPAGANLTLQNLTIANGSASGGLGGGIWNEGGTLTVTNSTFSNNSAANGGGIFNAGTLIVTDSTFSGNSATSDGGGITNGSNSTATVTNSTFSGNSANAGGGIENNSGTLTVTNSTFSGNSGSVSGGAAISTWKGAATPPTTTIRNTILANSPSGVDCWNHTAGGAILDGGNNIIETNSGCSGIATITSDPNLDTLTGSPAYFPLNPGSPAIDTGDNATCPATDQRGVSRPKDGDGNGSAICDIGAFEKESLRVFLPLVVR